VKVYNIPETYKAIVPKASHRKLALSQTTHEYTIPENIQYIPEHQEQSKAGTYYQGAQSAGIGDHGLDSTGAQEEVLRVWLAAATAFMDMCQKVTVAVTRESATADRPTSTVL
jgi:hypothetical protein